MRFVAAAAAAALVAAACARTPGPACEVCAAAGVDGGWCAAHETGYVAGLRTTSDMLYDAAHAHPHPLTPDWDVRCPGCIEAIATDGWCARSGIGWVGRAAYHTRLAYSVALGDPRPVSTITCDVCRANAAGSGWCDRCGVGRLGNRAYADEKVYREAAVPFATFLTALATADHCELCAAAQVTGGMCPEHGIDYGNWRAGPARSALE